MDLSVNFRKGVCNCENLGKGNSIDQKRWQIYEKEIETWDCASGSSNDDAVGYTDDGIRRRRYGSYHPYGLQGALDGHDLYHDRRC